MTNNETKGGKTMTDLLKLADAVHRVTGYICDEKELQYISKAALDQAIAARVNGAGVVLEEAFASTNSLSFVSDDEWYNFCDNLNSAKQALRTEPKTVSLEKCAEAVDRFFELTSAPPENGFKPEQVAKAVLDSIGVKYE